MAAVLLGSQAEGSVVKLKENGQLVDFYVSKHNYESGLNGAGRTLLVRKDVYDERQWHTSDVNAWASCSLRAWLNSTYLNLLDGSIRALIGTTKYYYTPGNGNNSVTTRADAVFLLSMTELGKSHSLAKVEGSALPIANILSILAMQFGNTLYQWTRSPGTDRTDGSWRLVYEGSTGIENCTRNNGSRPIFTLPYNTYINDDGTVYQNDLPTAPGSITVPAVGQGAQAAITWEAATDPDGTVESYTLERSINSSGWTQIFSGDALTYTDTIGDWGTVAYRVCAVDDVGMSGEYATSETYTVQEGMFYISGPVSDMGQKTAPFDFTITTGISGDAQAVSSVTCTILLDGYTLHTDSTSTGEQTTVNIDVRTISGGAHTITVKADKTDYVSAVEQYTFTTPEIAFPSGGKAEQLQDQAGKAIFPQTTAALVQGIAGKSLAGNLEELYSGLVYGEGLDTLLLSVLEG